MAKISKSMLKDAKRAAREAGVDITSNKQDVKQAHRAARNVMRDTKRAKGEVKWNLNVGDLVRVKPSRNAEEVIGFIASINSTSARKINDYSQYVEVITSSGRFQAHPKHTKLIQRI